MVNTTTWVCDHCPTKVDVHIRLEYPPTHHCQPRMGRLYQLHNILEPTPPEAA